MKAISEDRLEYAVKVLLAEPEESPCYGMAIGNAAMSLLRLDRREQGEGLARRSANAMQYSGCPHPPTGVQILRNLAEAVAGQGRLAESLELFNMVGLTADALIEKHPEHADEIELQKAHAFGSWGGSLLHLAVYPAAIDVLNTARSIYKKH
jgi:hypothetical protein